MGWFEFIAALVAFFLFHAVPVQPPIKARIVAVIGARGFTTLFSLVSLLTLVWIVVAAGRAPVVPVWSWAPWQNHVAFTLMALAVAVLALGLARPNPLSFGGARNDAFDPADPGLIGWTRHPLLVAIGLWALAHLIANGALAHVILFGLFALFCGVGMKMIDRRKRRQMGEDWARLAATTRRITITKGGVIRLILAALVYVALLGLHPMVIGVSPLP